MLSGKKAVVAAVTNRFSLGWGIAQALHGAGAQVLITYQGERTERSVRQLAETLPGMLVAPLDVLHDDQIDALFERAGAAMGGLAGGFKRRDERMQQSYQQSAGVQSAQQNQRNAYNRAMAACLEGRGYTVK